MLTSHPTAKMLFTLISRFPHLSGGVVKVLLQLQKGRGVVVSLLQGLLDPVLQLRLQQLHLAPQETALLGKPLLSNKKTNKEH